MGRSIFGDRIVMFAKTMARFAAALAALPLLAAVAWASSEVEPNGMSGDSFGADIRAEGVIGEQMASESARVTLALLNQYRAGQGLPPVQLDPQMTQVAYQQAKAMADADFMDHNIVGDFGTRLKANRVLNVYAGENIGRNIRTADKMFDWWIHSPVHERNMVNPRVTRLGFAVVYSPKSGKPYWAMALASAPLR